MMQPRRSAADWPRSITCGCRPTVAPASRADRTPPGVTGGVTWASRGPRKASR